MNIQLPQILFQALNFSILMGALSYLLYRPIQDIFENRAKRIAEGQKAAEESLAEKKNLEQHVKEVKQEAKKEAALILEEAKKQAQESKKKLMADAKAEAEALIDKQKKSWKAEKEQMVKDVRSELVEAVIAASEKVLGAKLDKKSHTKLVDKEIDQIIKEL